jgi:DNA-binding IclR family transcriptional regulator
LRTRRKNTLQSLAHAVELLELLREHPGGLGLSDLSRRLRLTKPSTSRILNTLLECRYLTRREADGRYGLGVKLWQLGCAAVERESSLREAAAPVLQRLAEQSNETANLSVYDHGRTVYVDSVESRQPLRFSARIGSSAPAYCVATGKALLAFQPPGEAEAVVAAGLQAFTPRTITTAADMARELASIRASGISRNRGEYEPGVGAIGVPVFGPDGQVAAALSIAGPLIRLDGPRIATKHTHGTGCVLSAALTAGLAAGLDVPEAAQQAKKFVTRAIERHLEIGEGIGPVNPAWGFW